MYKQVAQDRSYRVVYHFERHRMMFVCTRFAYAFMELNR